MQKKKERKSRVIYRLQKYETCHQCCCRVSEVSIDLSWMNRSISANWNFILYCYETKGKKNCEKLEHKWRNGRGRNEKKSFCKDRWVILLWINPSFVMVKECEGLSGRILLAMGFLICFSGGIVQTRNDVTSSSYKPSVLRRSFLDDGA